MLLNKLGCVRWASAPPPIHRTVDPVGAEIQIRRTAICLISVRLFQVRLIPIRLIPIGLIQIRLLAIQGKGRGVGRGIAQKPGRGERTGVPNLFGLWASPYKLGSQRAPWLKVRSALSARRTIP
jgi:hypothetical protein